MAKRRKFRNFIVEILIVMNKIQPLDQVCSIVAFALNQITRGRKYQDFFIETMLLIFTIYGKLNFLSMSQHGDSCDSRFRQKFKKAINVAKKLADKILQQTRRRLSVASVKKVLHNDALYQHIKKLIEGRESDNSQNKQVLSDDIPTNLLFFDIPPDSGKI